MSFRIDLYTQNTQTNKKLTISLFSENSLKIMQNSEEKDGAQSPRTSPKSPHP